MGMKKKVEDVSEYESVAEQQEQLAAFQREILPEKIPQTLELLDGWLRLLSDQNTFYTKLACMRAAIARALEEVIDPRDNRRRKKYELFSLAECKKYEELLALLTQIHESKGEVRDDAFIALGEWQDDVKKNYKQYPHLTTEGASNGWKRAGLIAAVTGLAVLGTLMMFGSVASLGMGFLVAMSGLGWSYGGMVAAGLATAVGGITGFGISAALCFVKMTIAATKIPPAVAYKDRCSLLGSVSLFRPHWEAVKKTKARAEKAEKAAEKAAVAAVFPEPSDESPRLAFS